MKNQNTNISEEMLLNYDSGGNLGANGGALNESGTGATSTMYAYSMTNTAGAWSQCYATMQNYKVWENAGQPLPKYNDKDYGVYSKQFIGALRTYEIDITDWVEAGENTICVKVQRPFMRADLFWSWLDWHTMPADNNMGLTGEVWLSTSGEVRISNPFVASKVSADLSTADLKLYADLSEMLGEGDVTGILTATVNKPDGSKLLQVSKEVTVPSSAYSKEYCMSPDEFPELSVSGPELWWPFTHGGQPLYTVDFEFVVDGVISGTEHQRFGIREISAEINTSPMSNSNLNSQMLQVYVNHKPVLLQGAGLTPVDIL
jgi:exo-1,4-beta-D-glucosaminidase